MIARAFHAWERRLASVDQNRIVRPFEWGLDWLGLNTDTPDPAAAMSRYSAGAMSATRRVLHRATPLERRLRRQPARVRQRLADAARRKQSRHTARCFRARYENGERPTRAVVVLPQWNADEGGHVGLCQGLAHFGITAVRLVLPYHERPAASRSPARRLHRERQRRPDAAVESAGRARCEAGRRLARGSGLHANRHHGHEPRVVPLDADDVARPAHSRRRVQPHLPVLRGRRLARSVHATRPRRTRGPRHARCAARLLAADQSVAVHRSRQGPQDPARSTRATTSHSPSICRACFLAEFDRRGVPHDTAVLPCGHYTTGKAPFKFLDGYYIVKHFRAAHL